METYHGQVRTPTDAIVLFEACRLGTLPRVQRRLSEKERQSIRSGSIFVWDEREAGMRRWTDGKSWSASRVSGSFLTYREMEGKRGGSNYQSGPRAGRTPESNKGSDSDMDGGGGEGPDGYRYKPDGLMKQSFSITTSTGQHLHLISYYARQSGAALQPSQDPQLRHIRPPKGMYPEASLAEQTQTPLVTRTPMATPPMPNGHPGFQRQPVFPMQQGIPYMGQPYIPFHPTSAPTIPGPPYPPPHMAYPQPIHAVPHAALAAFQNQRVNTPPISSSSPPPNHVRTGSNSSFQNPLLRPFSSNSSEPSILSRPPPNLPTTSTPQPRGTILPAISDIYTTSDEMSTLGSRTRSPSPSRNGSISTQTSRDTNLSSVSYSSSSTPKPTGNGTTIPSIGTLVSGVLEHEARSRSASRSPASHSRALVLNGLMGVDGTAPENQARDIDHSRIRSTGEDLRALRVLDRAFRT